MLRFNLYMISFRFLYQTQSNHDLLSRGYSNLRVHHILLVMSHAVFETLTRWLLEECCCVRRYATSFSPLIHKQGTTYNLSDSNCQLECMLEPLLYEYQMHRQSVTTLLGTYLSDEMNFWFTFTLYGYYFSIAPVYGKEEKSYTVRSKINTTIFKRKFRQKRKVG